MVVAARPGRLVVALLLAATLIATACSSDEPTTTTASSTAFVDDLDGACRTASKLIRKLDPTAATTVSDLADHLSNALDSIANLEPPASMSSALDTFTARIEEQITALSRLARAVRNEDDSSRRAAIADLNDLRDAADTAAIKLGAAKCVGLTPADGLAPPPNADVTTTSSPQATTTTAVVETTVAPTTTAEPTTTVAAPDETTTTPAPTTTVAPTSPPTVPPAGPPTVLTVESTSVRNDSKDSCGNPTSYPATNVLDGLRDTAWMGAGDATGESLIFHLAAPSTITRVGLVPGYDKFDPCTKTDRFFDLRRISAVRWTFDDGTVLEQTLDPNSPSMQYIPVPAGVTTQDITMRIVSTTAPGTLDHTPISEVSVL
jgi:hypothetical protein